MLRFFICIEGIPDRQNDEWVTASSFYKHLLSNFWSLCESCFWCYFWPNLGVRYRGWGFPRPKETYIRDSSCLVLRKLFAACLFRCYWDIHSLLIWRRVTSLNKFLTLLSLFFSQLIVRNQTFEDFFHCRLREFWMIAEVWVWLYWMLSALIPYRLRNLTFPSWFWFNRRI